MTLKIPQASKAPDGTSFALYGPKGAPVVVLIHGLGLCRDVFDGLRSSLSGYRVLEYDLYGHGQSAAFNGTTTLRSYAEQVAALMDHCDIPRATLIGFSIGGMINRRFALDYPERCEGLVIVNSPHDRGAEGQTAVEARAAQARTGGTLATMQAALTRWFTDDARTEGTGPAKVTRWRAEADTESYAQTAWVLAAGVPELINPTPPITTRTLVITCENDPGSTPAMSRAIAAEIPEAKLVIIPKLRHLGLMENPEPFAKPILDFLR